MLTGFADMLPDWQANFKTKMPLKRLKFSYLAIDTGAFRFTFPSRKQQTQTRSWSAATSPGLLKCVLTALYVRKVDALPLQLGLAM